MKRVVLIVGPLLVLLLALVVFRGSPDPQKVVAKELDLDVSGGRVISSSDTHGGFHGDGMTFIVLEFSGDEVLAQIKENPQWSPLPLDDTVSTVLYGKLNGAKSVAPLVSDGQGKALVPQIQEGYYLLLDRHTGAGGDILSRASFNFTVAVYDSDTGKLYLCKLNT